MINSDLKLSSRTCYIEQHHSLSFNEKKLLLRSILSSEHITVELRGRHPVTDSSAQSEPLYTLNCILKKHEIIQVEHKNKSDKLS